jgi:hypothetical protein
VLIRLCNVLHLIGVGLFLSLSLLLLSVLLANLLYSVPDEAILLDFGIIRGSENLQDLGAKRGDWIVDGKLVRRSEAEIALQTLGSDLLEASLHFFYLGLVPFLFTYGLRYILTGNKHPLPFKESK